MTPDPDLTGPPEYQPDEDPGDDDAALFAAAAYEMAGWEYLAEQSQMSRGPADQYPDYYSRIWKKMGERREADDG